MNKTRVISIDVGIINLSFCIVDFIHNDDATTFNLVHVEKAQIGQMSHKSVVLAESAIDFFRDSSIVNEEIVDYVFIENQISKAVKNTVVGYAIYSYFYTEMRISQSDTIVKFIPPRAKFKAVDAAFPDSCILGGVNPNILKSKELKKLSVKIGKRLFEEYNVTKGLEALVKYKPKLDDVCDVWCQSFSVYLEDGDFSSRSRKLS